MRRTVSSPLLVAFGLLLVTAAPALADNGEGWVGQSDDALVTFVSLGLIVFFPVLVTLLSLLQWGLDRRKDRRKAAALRRRAGW